MVRVHTSVYGGFFEPVYLAVTCSVLVLPEVSSGISCNILYQCLVRQRIHALRQSTERFEEAHTFST